MNKNKNREHISSSHNSVGSEAVYTQQTVKQLLSRLVLGGVLVFALFSIIVFSASYQASKSDAIASLKLGQASGLRLVEPLFQRIENYTQILEQRFLTRYRASVDDADWQTRFDSWYQESSPGVYRSDRSFFVERDYDGLRLNGITGFATNHGQPFTDELRARITIAHTVLAELGASWEKEIRNAYISMPENAVITYDPQIPWGLMIENDTNVTDPRFSPSANPDRLSFWTSLYLDPSETWGISFHKPMDLEGTHLGNASLDIRLDSLVRQLLIPHADKPGTLAIVDTKGMTVASTLNADEGSLEGDDVLVQSDVAGLPDSALQEAVAFISGQENSPLLTDSLLLETGDYIIVGSLMPKLQWWYLSIQSKSAFQGSALRGSLKMIVPASFLMFATLVMSYVAISRQIAKPLTAIEIAALKLRRGEYSALVKDHSPRFDLADQNSPILSALVAAGRRLQRYQESLDEYTTAFRSTQLEDSEAQPDTTVGKALGQIGSRLAFDRNLEHALYEPSDEHRWVAIVVIDDLKTHTEVLGFERTEKLKDQIKKLLHHRFPGGCYQYSPEEWALLLQSPRDVDATELLESICRAVAEVPIEHLSSGERINLKLCIGATRLRLGELPDQTIKRADLCFYHAKMHHSSDASDDGDGWVVG